MSVTDSFADVIDDVACAAGDDASGVRHATGASALGPWLPRRASAAGVWARAAAPGGGRPTVLLVSASSSIVPPAVPIPIQSLRLFKEVPYHAAYREVVSPNSVSEVDSDPRPVIIESDEEEEIIEWESDPDLEPMELELKPREDLEVVSELEDDTRGGAAGSQV
ncbi:hypothetical protein NL676_030096 [Syzygium grande]|nr:hypothetical protein NL676_030096 [Syzygium grande]